MLFVIFSPLKVFSLPLSICYCSLLLSFVPMFSCLLSFLPFLSCVLISLSYFLLYLIFVQFRFTFVRISLFSALLDFVLPFSRFDRHSCVVVIGCHLLRVFPFWFRGSGGFWNLFPTWFVLAVSWTYFLRSGCVACCLYLCTSDLRGAEWS